MLETIEEIIEYHRGMRDPKVRDLLGILSKAERAFERGDLTAVEYLVERAKRI